MRLAAVHWPRPGAQRMIALHGWLDNAATWSRLLPLLDVYDVCALDLAGHGRSDHRPPGVPYHFIDNVADVIGAAEALDWPRFGLLGHSLGAAVGTLVAGTVADRVDRLVCVEGFGPLSTAPEAAPAQLEKSIARYRGSTGRVRRFDSLEEAARVRAGATKVSLAAARLLCERGTRIDNGSVVWSSDPRLRYDSPMRLTEDQVCAFIGRIDAPVLVLHGNEGLSYPKGVYARRVAACRRLETVTVDGHHHLHLEDDSVAGVAAAIAEFEASV